MPSLMNKTETLAPLIQAETSNQEEHSAFLWFRTKALESAELTVISHASQRQ